MDFQKITFNQDCFPQDERGSGSGLQDVGAMESGNGGEEILTVLQEDARS